MFGLTSSVKIKYKKAFGFDVASSSGQLSNDACRLRGENHSGLAEKAVSRKEG